MKQKNFKLGFLAAAAIALSSFSAHANPMIDLARKIATKAIDDQAAINDLMQVLTKREGRELELVIDDQLAREAAENFVARAKKLGAGAFTGNATPFEVNKVSQKEAMEMLARTEGEAVKKLNLRYLSPCIGGCNTIDITRAGLGLRPAGSTVVSKELESSLERVAKSKNIRTNLPTDLAQMGYSGFNLNGLRSARGGSDEVFQALGIVSLSDRFTATVQIIKQKGKSSPEAEFFNVVVGLAGGDVNKLVGDDALTLWGAMTEGLETSHLVKITEIGEATLKENPGASSEVLRKKFLEKLDAMAQNSGDPKAIEAITQFKKLNCYKLISG